MKGIAFTVSLIAFIVGILLMGYAFSAVGWELIVFAAGIGAIGVALFIPFHLLDRADG